MKFLHKDDWFFFYINKICNDTDKKYWQCNYNHDDFLKLILNFYRKFWQVKKIKQCVTKITIYQNSEENKNYFLYLFHLNLK